LHSVEGGTVSSLPSTLTRDSGESGSPVSLAAERAAIDTHWWWSLNHWRFQHHDKFVSIVDPRGYAVAKRLFDIVCASLLLALTAPLWIVTAVLVGATSPGPIFFRQTRLGRAGKPFVCFKFRSMTVTAERDKDRMLHLNETTGPVFKVRNDPRLTPVGKWLRRLSVDELPQLFNVLLGDMSLVGPRPPLPEEVEKYQPRQRGRLAVKPGLTCIWQVSGRSHIGFEQWVELDLEYIRRRGFWLDLQLLVRTVPAVLKGRGAC
jgi:exopolysaccharide biosynthesis polyprenyl glycosylphosphotransferase